MTQNILGVALWYAGRTSEADTVFRTALARDSSFDVVARNLFTFYLTTGRTQDASALLAARGDTSALNRALVQARSDTAAHASALAALGRLKARGLFGRSYMGVARSYAFLGEIDSALGMLKRAAADRDPGLEMIKVDPFFSIVRQEPRFEAVLRRIGVPP